ASGMLSSTVRSVTFETAPLLVSKTSRPNRRGLVSKEAGTLASTSVLLTSVVGMAEPSRRAVVVAVKPEPRMRTTTGEVGRDPAVIKIVRSSVVPGMAGVSACEMLRLLILPSTTGMSIPPGDPAFPLATTIAMFITGSTATAPGMLTVRALPPDGVNDTLVSEPDVGRFTIAARSFAEGSRMESWLVRGLNDTAVLENGWKATAEVPSSVAVPEKFGPVMLVKREVDVSVSLCGERYVIAPESAPDRPGPPGE